MAFSVHTDQFSGPFDLLLRLVATQKLAIEDIQISEICDQYLQELDRLQSFDIALTADFLVVASSLLFLKARALFPEDESWKEEIADSSDEELFDLANITTQEELIRRLLYYRNCKNASAYLERAHAQAERSFVFLTKLPRALDDVSPRLMPHPALSELVSSYEVFSKRETSSFLDRAHTQKPRRPIADCVKSVRALLALNKRISFRALLSKDRSPEHVVESFLAMLELVHTGEVSVRQAQSFGEIELIRSST